MQLIDTYREEFLNYQKKFTNFNQPKNLYDPIKYILELGGKRLRPILTLMTTDVFGGHYRNALDAALAIEVFHNFSLVHDDIMDKAPLRRGKATVHEKWDTNSGVLSGDTMLILAYQLFESYDGEAFKSLINLFSRTGVQVCEGQQYDMDFETIDNVSIDEYLKMIEYKTAVLVAAAMQMGAIIAGANEKDQIAIYEFGRSLGIAFQLQDDYLDAFGDAIMFGKQVGGDIIENKKTYLYIKALEFSSQEDKNKLQELYSSSLSDNEEKIEAVKAIFIKSGSAQATQDAIADYTENAFSVLDKIDLKSDKIEILKTFGTNLMNRKM